MFANIKIKEGEVCIGNRDFNDVVRENTDFVMAIVRKFVRNPEIVKDLTQEIFIRAYLNYDNYVEEGKVRAWLSVIAHNKLKSYYKAEKFRNERVIFSPLEYFENESLTSDETPEEIVIQKDFSDRIIAIINTLPPKQRDVIIYSYLYGYSENKIAEMKNISVGSVKSAKHYGLKKVKNLFMEGNNTMNRLEAYSLLYQYAKGHISQEDKLAVEEYLKTDGESKDIAEALKILHTKLTYAREDELTHFVIEFSLKNDDKILYTLCASPVENYQKLNEYLETHDGYTPKENTWFGMGHKGEVSYIANFDNEGNKLETEEYSYEEDKNLHRIYVKRMKKAFPCQYIYTVYYYNKKEINKIIKQSVLAPNLYEAKRINFLGNAAKSSIYHALPENAVNIRMIRGNGVIDCGKYKFIYADRYVTADEGIHVECTFNLET